MGKNLPLKEDMRAPNIGNEDPLEKKMASHWDILAWKIP